MKKQKTEKKKDLKSLKKKRIIVVIALSFLVVLVGATVAYHTSHGSFLNLFRVARAWSNTTYDEFTSPSNWASCEEVPKVVYGKNTGDVPAAVRMKYEEYWKAANSTSTDHTTELPLQDNNIDVAVVNLQNLSDWTNGGDGWYYYNFVLDPGDETTSLLKSVTLNCNNNFAGANDVCSTVNGVTTCTKQDNQYDGAHYHVFVTVEYIENRVALDEWGTAPSGKKHMLYNAIANQLNDLGEYQIDFTKPATVSDDVATANGNGVNMYTEDGKKVYYYRGEIHNNNVIWANQCWKILRTTSTGGIKLVYGGNIRSMTVNGQSVQGCYDSVSVMSYTKYGAASTSPTNVGYMYGNVAPTLTSTTDVYYYQPTFANTVSYTGGTYYLGVADSTSGYWSNTNTRSAIGRNYHYFCTNRAVSCNASQIAYVTYAGYSDKAYYILLSGAKNIADLKSQMFSNTNSSSLKTALDNNYVSLNLDGHTGGKDYGDELEDAVYCNDRTFTSGPLQGETSTGGDYTSSSKFASYGRIIVNKTPSLDCNKNDAFTKNESARGNGALTYKVGTISFDEAALAGVGGTSSNTYLKTSSKYWTMSPRFSDVSTVYMFLINSNGSYTQTSPGSSSYTVPVVTIKAGAEYEDGGDGTAEKPYVVKY